MQKNKKTHLKQKKSKSFFEAKLFQKMFIIVFSMMSLILFIYAAVIFYPSTAKRIAEESIDLTGHPTKVMFGESPKCKNSIDCWVLDEFDDQEWPVFNLPNSVIRRAKEYKYGENIWLYYRITLDVPPQLINENEEIAFSPMYVNHNIYEVYLNNTKIHAGNKIGDNPGLLVITIPKEVLKNGQVKIMIKGSMFHNYESGISHRAYWLLGKEHLLRQLYLDQERSTSTFHLLFLLSKGGIIIIFSIIFVFMSVQRGFFSFLIFAIFSSFENILIAPYLGEMLSLQTRNNIIFCFKSISMVAFFSFLVNYLHLKKKNSLVLIVSSIVFLVISLALWEYNFGESVNILTLLNITQVLWLLILLMSILLCLFILNKIRLKKMEVNRISFFRNIFLALCLYFSLILWISFFTGTYKGFDFKPVIELLFFLYIATETFQGFSFNLQEKARMEQSLIDARNISKLFIPASVPDWNKIKISTFHKQLEEAGGDWYSFLTSPSERYHYFIMCDVTGHGVQAALIVSACRSVLSSFIKRQDRRKLEGDRFIKAYISELNDILYSDGNGYFNTTFLALIFDTQENKISFINCGHPNAIVIKNPNSQNIKFEPLISHPHSNLGVSPVIEPEIKSRDLNSDEIIITFTDALLLDKYIFKKRFEKSFINLLNTFYKNKSIHTADFCHDLLQIIKLFQIENKLEIIDKDDTTLVSFHLS